MPKVKQLTVQCGNRPGALAHVARVLGERKVNIQGFLLRTSGAKGFLQLVVNNVERAKKALDEAELRYSEETVLHARIPNRPGALARFAGRLAAKGINITFGYQTIARGSRMASIVLEVSNVERAARAARGTPSDRLYD